MTISSNMPEFDITEVFAEEADTPAEGTSGEPTTAIAYDTDIHVPGSGDMLNVATYLGTQFVSPTTGRSLGMTEEGPIFLTVTTGDTVARIKISADTGYLLRDSLNTALKAAGQRDMTLDKPRKDNP